MSNANAYHVYPVGDLKDHILDGQTCWCKPVEVEHNVIVHNSLDGREQYETGARVKS